MQRSSPFGSSFGEHQRACWEIKGGDALAPGKLGLWLAPVQPAGNNQVQHQPEIVIDSDGDALANAPQLAHNAAFDFRQRRLRGAQHEWTGDAHALKRLADNT